MNAIVFASSLSANIYSLARRLRSGSRALIFFLGILCFAVGAKAAVPKVHCWEMYEITLKGTGKYQNIYRDVECWVRLKGPGFDKKVWGFWDGKDEQDPSFRVRVLATVPGTWTWTSASNMSSFWPSNTSTASAVSSM